MFRLQHVRQTRRDDIASYNWEEGAMPSYGYWLFRDGHAIGWYAEQTKALEAIYDLGYNEANS